MAIQPFWWSDNIVLGAGAAGMFHFPISAGTTARIKRLVFSSLVPAIGGFSVQSIRDHTGKSFTDADAADPIWEGMLVESAIITHPVQDLDPPIEIEGPGALDIGILAVGADTFFCVAQGSIETG